MGMKSILGPTVNTAKQSSYDTNLYDSYEHFQFCQKWKVSGQIEDYPYWQEMLNQLKPNLDNGYYGLIVSDAMRKFGFRKASQIVDTTDSIYDQFGIIANHEKEKLMVYDFKREREIWKLENLNKVFLNYLKKYAEEESYDLLKIEEKANKVRNHVFVPLINELIQPALWKYGHYDCTESEIKRQLAFYDKQVFNLKKQASLVCEQGLFKFKTASEKNAIEEKLEKKNLTAKEKLNCILKKIEDHHFDGKLHGGGVFLKGKWMAKSAASIIKKIDILLSSDEGRFEAHCQDTLDSIASEIQFKQEPSQGYLFGLGAREDSTAKLYKDILELCGGQLESKRLTN